MPRRRPPDPLYVRRLGPPPRGPPASSRSSRRVLVHPRPAPASRRRARPCAEARTAARGGPRPWRWTNRFRRGRHPVE